MFYHIIRLVFLKKGLMVYQIKAIKHEQNDYKTSFVILNKIIKNQ
jgi:hypothetical protein